MTVSCLLLEEDRKLEKLEKGENISIVASSFSKVLFIRVPLLNTVLQLKIMILFIMCEYDYISQESSFMFDICVYMFTCITFIKVYQNIFIISKYICNINILKFRGYNWYHFACRDSMSRVAIDALHFLHRHHSLRRLQCHILLYGTRSEIPKRRFKHHNTVRYRWAMESKYNIL